MALKDKLTAEQNALVQREDFDDHRARYVALIGLSVALATGETEAVVQKRYTDLGALA